MEKYKKAHPFFSIYSVGLKKTGSLLLSATHIRNIYEHTYVSTYLWFVWFYQLSQEIKWLVHFKGELKFLHEGRYEMMKLKTTEKPF